MRLALVLVRRRLLYERLLISRRSLVSEPVQLVEDVLLDFFGRRGGSLLRREIGLFAREVADALVFLLLDLFVREEVLDVCVERD